jgi:8-oxo-dGTP pyrophosphatase MutT (NUDIX family)
VAAAIREAFEETGILLAEAGCADPGALDVARRALLSGVVGLREIAVNQNLRLDACSVIYLAHWITPEPEPRRYDTRFFLARVPEGAVCDAHQAELVDSEWMAPAEAVSRFERGELRLLPPTVHTLRRLVPFASVGAMLAALRDAPVPRILPRMRRRPEGVEIVVPDTP